MQRIQTQTVERGASGGVQSQTYRFDALGRLASLNANGTQGARLTTYSYDGNTDRLRLLSHPNGTKSDLRYDGLGRLQHVFNGANGDAFHDRYSSNYDAHDIKVNTQSRTGSANPLTTTTYTYDALDQLKQENVTGGVAGVPYTTNYNYDAMGNRTQVNRTSATSSSTTTSTPNALNQLTGLTTAVAGGPTSGSNLSYDTAGNLTMVANNDGTRTRYVYDDADRLVQVGKYDAADALLTLSGFGYDYAGRRVVSVEYNYARDGWANPGYIFRVYDGMDVVQERDNSNQVTAQLVRDGNIGGILSRTTATGAAFYGYDGNGNVTLLTDSAGQDVGHYRYDAFGQTLEATGPRAGENPYRFSTKEFHAQSGLYDYGFRFYSPGMGRWLNRDPIAEEGGINLYAMVGNNPVNDIDPYGLVGVITIASGNKISIYLPIEWKGAGATKAVVKKFTQGIERAWTGKFGKYQVTMKVIDQNQAKYPFPKWNVITVVKGNFRSNAQIGGYYGKWGSQRSGSTAAHEAGHLLGLRDRYKDVKDKNGKTIGITARDPKDKDWNKNIMGDHNKPPSEKDITDIINYPYNTQETSQEPGSGRGFGYGGF